MGYLINNIQTNSGTWVPTFSNLSSNISGIALINAYYSQIGNIITASISASATFDFSVITTAFFDVSLPPYNIGNAIGITAFNQYLIGTSDVIIGNTVYLKTTALNPLNPLLNFIVNFQYSTV